MTVEREMSQREEQKPKSRLELLTDGRTANELIDELYDDKTGLPK